MGRQRRREAGRVPFEPAEGAGHDDFVERLSFVPSRGNGQGTMLRSRWL